MGDVEVTVSVSTGGAGTRGSVSEPGGKPLSRDHGVQEFTATGSRSGGVTLVQEQDLSKT